MSESGESQPQDDSDEDIYKDFSDFNFGDELAKLELSKETIKKEALDLSEQVKVLTKENEELRKSNEILKKNVSSLLKTAQAEVQRKDSMISELRNKVDSFTFRRRNRLTKDAFTSTQDLEISVKMKNGCEESKNVNEKRSKSKEYRSNGESERRPNQDEQRKKDSGDERETLNCDNNRKFGSYRDSTRRKSRHLDSNYETYNTKESHFRKSTKNNEPDYRGSYTDGLKDHLKYHSLDRRKRSRSSDRRFTYKRRSPRTRRSDRMEDSPEVWRREKKEDISEGSQRRRHSGRGRSRSRELSKGSKESSLDPLKTRSPDRDSGGRIREISNKVKETNSVNVGNDESKKERGHSDKEKTKKNHLKTGSRISKDECSGKNEKGSELQKFSTKSPLDALYKEMMVSRSTSRFSKLGPGVDKPELDFEGDKFAKTERPEASHVEEDWTLSFKNERIDSARPMTLYSKRMLKKLSETKEAEEKLATPDEILTEMKKSDSEKESGELTDDENIIESSKEFQELAQAASIESEAIEKSKESEPFKEPMTREPPLIGKTKVEMKGRVEESSSCKEAQRETRDVIEYSPFKNNYKLIEISPVKLPNKEHILELHKRASTEQAQKEVESSIFSLLSSLSGVSLESKVEEKKTNVEQSNDVQGESENKSESKTEQPQVENEKLDCKPRTRRASKSTKAEKMEKSFGEENRMEKSEEVVGPGETTQFLDFFLLTTSPSKPIVPGQPETPGKTENTANAIDLKSDVVNSSSEMNPNAEVSHHRKRKRNSGSESKSKKMKMDESERKRTRSRRNSANKTDQSKAESQPEPETEVKEDITKFEFFKPIAKKDTLDASIECKMTAMSVTNIVCLETPNKGLTSLKNLTISEQTILNVLDSKNAPLCSPLTTPRRLLKNDLLLTDSEDDLAHKGNVEEADEEEEEEMSGSDNSECESDSGASDFVDLL